MSSYSEYLGRYKQKLANIKDTRPQKRTASQQTEIIKRTAAAQNYQTTIAATACVIATDMTKTRTAPQYYNGSAGNHVRPASAYLDYVAGQAQAQGDMPRNAKPSQINLLCLSTSALPEWNDKLATDDAGLGAIQRAKQNAARGYTGCAFCGSTTRVQFASGCNCRIPTSQLLQTISGVDSGIKSVNAARHTIEPNVNVATG